ncbi:MipA/OmpV family protein [Rheinheimera fenheensis]|uniref:MipA/OmpV family protein n=1 Tax=Rheinheimera fenheensis TaxID=3152295 RepID=UPI00325EE8DE
MRKLIQTSFMTMAMASVTGAAFAETQIVNEFTKDSSDWVYGLGLGLLSEDEGYVGMDRETDPTPILYIESERFRLMGLQAEYKALLGKNYSVGIHVETRMDGFEVGDSDFLDGMAEREGTFYAGFNIRTFGDWGQFSVKALRDVGNTHDGNRAAAEYRYSMPFAAGILTPWVEVEYYGADMMEYYYGVSGSEATETRPQYTPDATMNFDIGVDYQYSFGENHTFLASAKYRRFGGDLKDSPIVEDSGSARVLLAYVYRF